MSCSAVALWRFGLAVEFATQQRVGKLVLVMRPYFRGGANSSLVPMTAIAILPPVMCCEILKSDFRCLLGSGPILEPPIEVCVHS